MMLVEETSVPSAVLPVADFKEHLRLGTGFADDTIQDAVLESFLRAAMAAVEARTGKILISRDFSWSLSDWRNPEGQSLPVAPVTALGSVVITDRAGGELVVDPALYRLERDQFRPRILPAGTFLPAVPEGGAVRVMFSAGFAEQWDGLQADLSHAVFMLAAHYYEFRHDTGLGEGCMPFGVTALLSRYRSFTLLGGGGAA